MAIELSFVLFQNAHKLKPVTNPNALKAGKFKYSDDGLYSESIFGPLKNYKCSCETVFSRENSGVRCKKCGVLCDSSSLRAETFGRIDLPKGIYVVLPVFQNLLSNIFGQTAIKSIMDPKKYESNQNKPYYYSLSEKKLVKINRLKKDEKVIKKVVYDITTLHALYKFMLKTESIKDLILDYLSDPIISEYIFVNFVLVTPPDSRPMAKLNNQYQMHVISASYTEILKNIKNSFLDKTFAINSEAFGQTVYKYQISINKLYKEITTKNFQNKESIIRESLSGKTVENSQRAVIVPEPILPMGSLALHEETIKKLWNLDILYFMNKKFERAQNEDSTITRFVKTVHNQIDHNGEVVIDDEDFEEFVTDQGPDLKMIFERPPVLWRYNTSTAKLGGVYEDNKHRGIKQDRVIGVNSMTSQYFNLDYDGDNMSVIAINSEQGKAAFDKAYIENAVEFEHKRELLVSPEHESIYAAYMLSSMLNDCNSDQETIFEIDTINDLPFSIRDLEERITKNVYVKNLEVTINYGICLINKAINCNALIYKGEMLNKRNVKQLIKKIRNHVGDKLFYEKVHNFNKFLLECSTVFQECNPTMTLTDFAIGTQEIEDYKKTLIKEPYIAFHQNDILFTEYVKPEVDKDTNNVFGRVSSSDARIKSVQMLKAISNNGIPTDIRGKAFKENIKNSLLDGLSKKEFYISGDSARLALSQRQEAIPKGGELQRKFYFACGFLKLDDLEDCGSQRGFTLKVLNKTHLESLFGRFFLDGTEIDTTDLSLIGETITLRSPMYCNSKEYKVCKTCFGKKQPQSKSLGVAIGSYISEAIIQSVLRTHHFSGAFITHINKELKEAIKSVRFESPNKVYGRQEDIQKLKDILYSDKYYGSEGPNIVEFLNCETHYEIIQHETPFNDDSVKQLNNIIGMIDKKRDNIDMFQPIEMYNFLLDNVVLPNSILSIFIELIISILYYDEDGVMARYSQKPIDHQIALKNVINNLDPKLNIFHNFSDTAINRIYTTKIQGNLDHMYFSLLDCHS
ncbi:MAG: hypothetical protein WC136_01910 [Sphaerochaeta sp.]|jgi:DNA-directed RNA polymerase beta' subunit